MRGAFRGEICGEGFRVGDAGEVGAFEDVLVVGFAGEKERGGFRVDGGLKSRMLAGKKRGSREDRDECRGMTYCLQEGGV